MIIKNGQEMVGKTVASVFDALAYDGMLILFTDGDMALVSGDAFELEETIPDWLLERVPWGKSEGLR